MTIVETLGAVGVLFSVVVAALGGWYLKILAKQAEVLKINAEIDKSRRAQEIDAEKDKRDAEIAAERAARIAATKEKKDGLKEVWDLYERQSEVLVERGEEIHELRNRVEAAEKKEHLCQLRMTKMEADVAALTTRFEELLQYTRVLAKVINDHNLPVPHRDYSNPLTGSKAHSPLPPPEVRNDDVN